MQELERKPKGSRREQERARRRRNRRIRRIVICVVEVLMLVIVLGCCYVISKWDKIQHDEIDQDDIKVNSSMDASQVEVMQTGYRTIALLGTDSRSGKLERGVNNDVIIICTINNATGEVKLASVYRDTWMHMPDLGYYSKANDAMCQVGTSLASVNMLNENLDLTIDEYVTVNWAAVATAINLMGGLEDVTVPEEIIEGLRGYITSVVEETGIPSIQLEPGDGSPRHLDGVQAVALCRYRYQGLNDTGRTANQRMIIGKMLEKAKTLSLGQLISIADQVFPMVATTYSLNEVLDMAKLISKLYIGETVGFPMNAKGYTVPDQYKAYPSQGTDCLMPVDLAGDVKTLHGFLYNQTDYQPSPTVQRLSEAIKADVGFNQ
ncbi:LCP family protein [Cuneatibacter caecimuris]|uniref:LytR family transcriptional attenuator n=1 Tax=Cuneatibacter caecimuris TaxID=1796618 RepID=A0A4Q7NYZ9_9FIRM|nr:LCP family protein [Cuneatibacter caecimuris]RZS92676.1 LytR family transcriptional attenuator [Cuneatibacter caecimuris]